MMLPPDQKMCPRCGRRWPLSAVVCQACGHQFRTFFPGMPGGPTADPTRRVPAPSVCATARPHAGSHMLLVVILAIFFMGIGAAQMYNGQFKKGLSVLFFHVSGWITIILYCFGSHLDT